MSIKKIVFNNKKIIILIILAIFLRLINLLQVGYGFDQAQIIDASKEIVSGDLTLIGPRTGPASLFTGPLIYYINSFFFLFGVSYYSLIFTTLSISILTGASLFFIIKKYFNNNLALLSLLIWSFSNYFIGLDSVTWNPNLSFLASILVVLPIYNLIKTNRLDKIDITFIFLGSFLGYQSHFSLLMFGPLSFLIFLTKNKIAAFKGWVLVQAGLISSILPTVFFDLKHNWLNLNGLVDFINKIPSSEIKSDPYIYHLWKSFYTSIEIFGAILLNNFSVPVIAMFIFGLVIFVYFFIKEIKSSYKPENIFLILWLCLVIGFFSFYRGDKPPYYFIIQAPVFLIMYLKIYSKINKVISLKEVIFVFVIISLLSNISNLFHTNSFSITNQLKIKEYVKQQSAEKSINSIVYHLSESDGFGIKNMLSDIALDDNNSIGESLYIQYPNPVFFESKKFNDFYVWLQPSKNESINLFFDNKYRINSPNDIYFFRDNYYSGLAEENYVIIENNLRIGAMEVYSKNVFIEIFQIDKNIPSNAWTKLSNDFEFWYLPTVEKVFLIRNRLNENIIIF